MPLAGLYLVSVLHRRDSERVTIHAGNLKKKKKT